MFEVTPERTQHSRCHKGLKNAGVHGTRSCGNCVSHTTVLTSVADEQTE